jgi:hypothetical protein
MKRKKLKRDNMLKKMTQYYKDHLYLLEIHLEDKKAKFFSLKMTNEEKKVDSKDTLKKKTIRG